MPYDKHITTCGRSVITEQARKLGADVYEYLALNKMRLPLLPLARYLLANRNNMNAKMLPAGDFEEGLPALSTPVSSQTTILWARK